MALQPNEEANPLGQDNEETQPLNVNDSEKEIDLGSNVDQIKCGLSWDFFGKKVDLDVTVVALDTFSLELDAVYYKQLNIFDGAIQHSGDNRSGEERR